MKKVLLTIGLMCASVAQADSPALNAMRSQFANGSTDFNDFKSGMYSCIDLSVMSESGKTGKFGLQLAKVSSDLFEATVTETHSGQKEKYDYLLAQTLSGVESQDKWSRFTLRKNALGGLVGKKENIGREVYSDGKQAFQPIEPPTEESYTVCMPTAEQTDEGDSTRK